MAMVVSGAERDNLVNKLASLNERELIELLSLVFDLFAERFEASVANAGVRYALAKSLFDKAVDKEPYIEFLGVPSEPYLGYTQDAAYENGECPTCGVTVGCVDKLAKCPICGTVGVECT